MVINPTIFTHTDKLLTAQFGSVQVFMIFVLILSYRRFEAKVLTFRCSISHGKSVKHQQLLCGDNMNLLYIYDLSIPRLRPG